MNSTATTAGTTSPAGTTSAAATSAAATSPSRYLAPGWITRRVFNPMMTLATRLGHGPRGARILHVQGRSTGEWRTVPVNPLTLDGVQYLVAPRGETQWVRNMRVARGGRLQVGRTVTSFAAVELVDDACKAQVLQAYLRIWKAEVGVFFDGVDADSLEALQAIAGGYPTFVVTRCEAA
jgi:deazaflavin-dependent oxidoreductase (nitroreductase family)